MPVVSPTHCKMQGTGINFLHFAETFGLWMTLACKGRSENQIHGTEKKTEYCHFRSGIENSLISFYVINSMSCTSITQHVHHNEISYSSSVMTN